MAGTGGYDGSIKIDSRIDGRGFNAGMRGMINSVKNLAVAMGVAFGIGAILNFGKTAVSAASELASAMTGLQSVMAGQGRSFANAQKFIESYTRDGLIPATNAIKSYQNLALRGYSDEQIATVLTALKDSAAFGRRASLSMGEAVQTATEGLRNENSILVDNAGVTKNVAKMWDEYARSIGTTANNLTQQQKVQAEVNGILAETRFQVGDAAKAAGSYAGLIASLGTSFYNLRVAIGNSIIPILSAIIPYIKAVIDYFVVLFNTIARVVALFFNVNISSQATAGATAETADNLDSAAGGAGDLADNTKAAGKAAKGALAAFDELNVLATDAGSSMGSAGGPAGAPQIGGVEIGEPKEIIPDELTERIDDLRKKLLEFLGPAIEAFGRLKESLKGLGGTIWDGLVWVWENILVPLGTWVITDAVPAFLDVLSGVIDVLNEVLLALQPLGVWLFENFLQPMAEWTGGAIVDILGFVADALQRVADWIRDNQKTVENIALAIGAFALAWWAVNGAIAIWNGIAAIAAGVTLAFGGAVAFLTSPIFLVVLAIAALILIILFLVKNWDLVKEAAGKAWEWIKQKWYEAAAWFKTYVVDPIRVAFDEMWAALKQFATDAWEAVKTTWGAMKDWFNTNVIDPVKAAFTALWDLARTAASDAWTAVQDLWSGASAWFTEHVTDPIQNAFKTALDWISDKFSTIFGGLQTFAKNTVNTIISLLNGMISAIAAGLNAVIKALNSIKVKIPSWVPIWGNKVWSLEIPQVEAPQIPMLAKGAVIPPNSQFLAMLGDQRNGRNIETPEGLLRQIFREEAGQGAQEIVLKFEGSMASLVRSLMPEIDRERSRVGGSLVTIKGAA